MSGTGCLVLTANVLLSSLLSGQGDEKYNLLYSYHMYMRATVSLSAPRQEPLHEGVSSRATVLVEGLTNWPLPELHI